MAVVKIVHKYTFAGEPCVNIYHYWRNVAAPSNAEMTQLVAYWSTNQMSLVNAVQVEGVENTTLTIYSLSNPFIYELSVAGSGGDIAVDNADAVQVDLALNLKRTVGASFDPGTSAPYTGGRPVRRGRVWLSGLPKSFMAASGFVVDPTYATAWNALITGMDNAIQDSATNQWIPIVLGLPLDALPPSPTYPDGKPARGYTAAPITGGVPIEFAKLSSRDSD